MENNERNQLIAKLLSEGLSLSDVQKILKDQHQIQMTYMDLRLISTELEVNWKKFDVKKEKESAKALENDKASGVGDNTGATGASDGGTVVNVSKLVRPGAAVSGDVKFKSGGTAEWYLDAMGRLGLNPTGNSAKPTEEDLQDFQRELQKSLQGPA